MSKNVTRQNVMKDDLLLNIATSFPKTIEELKQVRGMRSDIIKGVYATEILELLNSLSEEDFDKNLSKQDKEKEDPVAKKEMKEMFSKVKLPSGMEIRQEGPSWVLLSKDGKQRTDITDVMNTIDKFNRNVDEANEQNRMQNAAQSGVDKAVDVNKKDEGLKVNETNDKVKVVGEALPNVKDVDGKQVFKPEDCKIIAEIAINYSNDLRELEAMKREAKRLEEEAKERRNKNDRDSDERNAKDAQRMQQQMQKMQNSM